MIRSATPDDLPRLLEIGKNVTVENEKITDPLYAAKVQRRGFIPEGFATEEHFKDEIEKGEVCLVSEENEVIQGFCSIKRDVYYPEDLDAVIWTDPDAKKKYYHDDSSIEITYLLLDPPFCQKGIGTNLLEEALSQAEAKGYKNFFWITTLAPLSNLASIAFISKHGGRRVNFTMPSDLFGLEDQQSILFLKDS